ncbi:hypothetical protein Zmor_020002 [Zophobas morio]|uniref:Uncharacterized protein n=1 Tax=Zophobas morio TaxID=2755281 RepID=A0AA38I2K8_9CUCU|nr:hypothetical protein Zmor_020002 [Zophobas morio]
MQSESPPKKNAQCGPNEPKYGRLVSIMAPQGSGYAVSWKMGCEMSTRIRWYYPSAGQWVQGHVALQVAYYWPVAKVPHVTPMRSLCTLMKTPCLSG